MSGSDFLIQFGGVLDHEGAVGCGAAHLQLLAASLVMRLHMNTTPLAESSPTVT